MNDRDLIRKAVQQTAAEYDVEKQGGLLRAGLKVIGSGPVARGIGSGIKQGKAAVQGVKTAFGGAKAGVTGKAPSVAPKVAPAATSTAGGTKVTYGSSRIAQQQAAKAAASKGGGTAGQWRTGGGQLAGKTAPTAAMKVGTGVRTAGSRVKSSVKAAKANPTGTPAARRAALKYGSRAAVVGAIGTGAVLGVKDRMGGGNQAGANQGGNGNGGSAMDRVGGPTGGPTGAISERGASRFMGRTGQSGHARQMMEGYKPRAKGYEEGQRNILRLFKEYLNNGTSPQLASSMPTTSSEMPASVFNDSMAEIAGQALPPVHLKVDELDDNAQNVTEAVMDKLEKDWNPLQRKSPEQKEEEESEKLWSHPRMQEMSMLHQKYPNTFGDRDTPDKGKHYDLYQQNPEAYHDAYMDVHPPTQARTVVHKPPNDSGYELLEDDTQTITNAVMDKLEKQGDAVPDAGAEARQIGQSMIDQIVYNPQMMNLGRGEKKLQQQFADLKFDPKTGMPLDPKTGEVMSEKQMTQLYGKGTRSQGMQQARGLGREVLSQPQQAPPTPEEESKTQ